MAVKAFKLRFLIDVWVEPRDIDLLPAVIRARVRDATTGEDRYVGSIREVESLIEARLDDEGIVPRLWERER